LKKLCHLLILSILFTVPSIYPFKLSQGLLDKINAWAGNHGRLIRSLWEWQLEPYLYFGLSPLTLKWLIAQSYIAALLVAFILLKVFSSGGRSNFFKNIPFILSFILIIYSGISALLISPTIHVSIMAFYSLVLFVVFFYIVSDVEKSPSFIIKTFSLISCVSLMLSFIALLQHLQLSDGFMLRFDRVRNSMGSFIGHNTGLSSYLMTSYFIAIAALSFIRNKWIRYILYLLLVMEGFVVVAAQSRAVIAILFFLTPIYLVYLHKTTGFSIRIQRLITAGLILCLIVLSQIIARPWNPFYFRDAPLVNRLQAFNPENLKGTRLRILTASRSLLRESPFYGHGFASFQYVYPKAQADYYTEHPNTLLIPTDLRSQQAHNDYLQISIELGFGGLLLIMLTLYLFLRRGQRAAEEVSAIWQRRLLCAIFFSLTAYLMHCFVDFPLQIPPLSLLILFLLAVWTSGERIWLNQKEQSTAPSPALLLMGSFWGRVFIIVLPLLLIALTPLANMINLRAFRSDLIFYKSDMYIQTFHQFPSLPTKERLLLLNNAVALAHQGTRQDPLNSEMQFKFGEASYLLGAFSWDLAKEAEKVANDKEFEFWKYSARLNLLRAVRSLETALNEFRFHSVYYLIGVCEEILARIEPEKNHLSRARENYAIAVRYSPAYAPALKDYSELLVRTSQNLSEREKAKATSEIIALRRLVLKYQPAFYQKYFTDRAYDALIQEDYEQAIPLMIDLVQVEPDNTSLQMQLITALCLAGQFEYAQKVLDEMSHSHPKHPDFYEAYVSYHLFRKDYAAALPYIRKRLESQGTNNNIFETLEALCLEALGKNDEAAPKIAELEKKSKEDPTYLQMLGMMYIDYFDNEKEGIPYLERRAALPIATNSKVYYKLAQHEIKQGNINQAKIYLERALLNPPKFKKARALYNQISQGKGIEADE